MSEKEEKKIDIHNKGNRTYHIAEGVALEPGRTLAVSASKAKTLMEAYPRDIISPNDLRSGEEEGNGLAHLAHIDALEAENTSLKGTLETVRVLLENSEKSVKNLQEELAANVKTVGEQDTLIAEMRTAHDATLLELKDAKTEIEELKKKVPK
jgi:chromosome segregation ATPase